MVALEEKSGGLFQCESVIHVMLYCFNMDITVAFEIVTHIDAQRLDALCLVFVA